MELFQAGRHIIISHFEIKTSQAAPDSIKYLQMLLFKNKSYLHGCLFHFKDQYFTKLLLFVFSNSDFHLTRLDFQIFFAFHFQIFPSLLPFSLRFLDNITGFFIAPDKTSPCLVFSLRTTRVFFVFVIFLGLK